MIEPGLGQFNLPAVVNLLAEHAIGIADAVAMRGNVDGRHAFHEASGEPAEAAIAECRIRLKCSNQIEIDAERRQRVAHIVHQAEIGERVAHKTADEKLKRQIVDALFLLVVGFFRRLHPAIDDAVANDLDRGGEPVVLGRDGGILADPIFEGHQDFRGERLGIGVFE